MLGFVQKPYNMGDLSAAVASALGEQVRPRRDAEVDGS